MSKNRWAFVGIALLIAAGTAYFISRGDTGGGGGGGAGGTPTSGSLRQGSSFTCNTSRAGTMIDEPELVSPRNRPRSAPPPYC